MKKNLPNKEKNASPSEGSIPQKEVRFLDVVVQEVKWSEKKETLCRHPTAIIMENLELFVQTDEFKKNPFCLYGLNDATEHLNNDDFFMDLLSYAITVHDLEAIDLIFAQYQKYENEKEEEYRQGMFMIKYELTEHPLHALIENKEKYSQDLFSELFVKFLKWYPERLWDVKSYDEPKGLTLEVLTGKHSDGLADFIVKEANQKQFELLFENLKNSVKILGSQHQCLPTEVGLKVFRRLFEQAALANHLSGFLKIYKEFVKSNEGAEYVSLEEEDKSLILSVGLNYAIQKANVNVGEHYKFVEQLMGMKIKKGSELVKMYVRFPADSVNFIEDAQKNVLIKKQVKHAINPRPVKKTINPGRF